jgi:hypothetical protein
MEAAQWLNLNQQSINKPEAHPYTASNRRIPSAAFKHSLKNEASYTHIPSWQKIVGTNISNASSPDPQQPLAVNVESGGS